MGATLLRKWLKPRPTFKILHNSAVIVFLNLNLETMVDDKNPPNVQVGATLLRKWLDQKVFTIRFHFAPTTWLWQFITRLVSEKKSPYIQNWSSSDSLETTLQPVS